jgi:hypothetical protein
MKDLINLRPPKKYKWRPSKEQIRQHYTKPPNKDLSSPESHPICRVLPLFVANHYDYFIAVAKSKKLNTPMQNKTLEESAFSVRKEILLMKKSFA